MAKTCLGVFSLSRVQVWTFSVLGDRIYEMRCPFVARVIFTAKTSFDMFSFTAKTSFDMFSFKS